MYDYNSFYSSQDKCVGEKCFINNKECYLEYNADLVSFHIQPGGISNQYIIQTGQSSFLDFGGTTEPKTATVEFYVGGASDEQAHENISNLFLACKECILKRELHRFEYPALLTGKNVEETGVEPYYLVTLDFIVVQRLPLVSADISEPAIIYNEGNIPSGVRYILKPPINISFFKINGIKVTNLHAGKNFIIDGISGKITENGNNRFAATDIIDFPKILPGKNEINMSYNIPVTVEYYPLFE
ncbi:hypothetical protein [Diplocloster agilis]|uniref:Uncharacterized protein n=1 Tax=Diplocloster agilis TaxID=2850323 RepID=A0A949JXB7_9FIRM|nr:hypothetical protein [Diplocloster agilis]MBU9735804.1 hypothetical protein [Diplocloster agilis]